MGGEPLSVSQQFEISKLPSVRCAQCSSGNSMMSEACGAFIHIPDWFRHIKDGGCGQCWGNAHLATTPRSITPTHPSFGLAQSKLNSMITLSLAATAVNVNKWKAPMWKPVCFCVWLHECVCMCVCVRAHKHINYMDVYVWCHSLYYSYYPTLKMETEKNFPLFTQMWSLF